MRHLPLALALALAACTSTTPTETGDTGTARTPGEDATITAFAREYVHFGEENRRVVDLEVELPGEETTYSEIKGRFALTCPNDRCDWWDRYGSFGIVLDPGGEGEKYVELDRFITAYRVGFSWESDLTPYRPLLTGTRTLRVYIDTWVTEGHANGDGRLFDAQLDFVGGEPPSPEPVANTPVWGHLSWNAGLDDQPVETQVEPGTVQLPEASAHTLRSFITGHGWNNAQNCAEFCEKEHFYTVDGTEFGRLVWREDCDETLTDGTQQGTWRYSRAGWCPGAQVFPWDTEVGEMLDGDGDADVSYRLEDFTWRGDGDQPYYYMSAMLISWR